MFRLVSRKSMHCCCCLLQNGINLKWSVLPRVRAFLVRWTYTTYRKRAVYLQGHPRLVKALSDTYSPLFGRNIDMNEEILCTFGAYGSLFCAMQSLINPGDEVRTARRGGMLTGKGKVLAYSLSSVVDWLVDWLIDFYWTLLQPKCWIAKYNMYTKIENTNNRKYNTKNMHNVSIKK